MSDYINEYLKREMAQTREAKGRILRAYPEDILMLMEERYFDSKAVLYCIEQYIQQNRSIIHKCHLSQDIRNDRQSQIMSLLHRHQIPFEVIAEDKRDAYALAFIGKVEGAFTVFRPNIPIKYYNAWGKVLCKSCLENLEDKEVVPYFKKEGFLSDKCYICQKEKH